LNAVGIYLFIFINELNTVANSGETYVERNNNKIKIYKKYYKK